MTEISTLKTIARVNEVGGTTENILKAYADCAMSEDANLQSIIDLLAQKNAQLITAIEKGKAYSQLEKCDEERDQSFKALYHYIKACTLLPEGVTRNAAQIIFPIFDKYGISMTYLAYTEQTAQMKSLIEELEKEEIKSEIGKIVHLEGMVESLKNVQASFQQAHSDYTSQVSTLRNEQSASELKPQVLEVLNEQLVMYMRAMAKAFPQTHGKFAIELATEISKTNQNIKSRSNKESAENAEG